MKIIAVIAMSLGILGCTYGRQGIEFDKKEALLFGLRSCDGEHTIDRQMRPECQRPPEFGR